MLIRNTDKKIVFDLDPVVTYDVYAVQDAQDGLVLTDDMILVQDIEVKDIAIGFCLAVLTYLKYTHVFVVKKLYLEEGKYESSIAWQSWVESKTTSIDAEKHLITEENPENS